jgi:CHAT domain-containing protein
MVEAELKDGGQRYDVVHFAGHALFESPNGRRKGAKNGNDNPGDEGKGYLIFSGFPAPEAVPIATVARWLAKAGVQLVYLSCCRSSASRAAMEFARNDIPMALGFHWDLEDAKAPDFSERFYEELVASNLKVCPAVNNARVNLYEKYDGEDPIWASPVLIAQPMDWLQVEGVLKLASKGRDGQTPPYPPLGSDGAPGPVPAGREAA